MPEPLWNALAARLCPDPAGLDPSHVPLLDAAEARVLEACRREIRAWDAVHTLEDWASFLKPRLAALRESLGSCPTVPESVRVSAHGFDADGLVVENLVFPGRPGLWVTANLYRPRESGGPAPGFLICHSHHNPKSQIELRDMGIRWARAGCSVLVMDQLGHGERRDHPFASPADHPHPFRVDRQDYWFRYVLGMQLDLVGESLMGWMVQDLMRGVDVLLGRPGVDAERIVLIGSVAGGGDVAAVTAALDPRIACVVPFNFGRASVPSGSGDAAPNFAGTGTWESTRNLRLSARDGFMPWLILAAMAPRRLIYAHEFGWDAEQDPTWKRLLEVFELHGVPENLAEIHGRGSVAGRPPHNTHCNNVGPIQRAGLDRVLAKWFDLVVPSTPAATTVAESELRCWTPELKRELQPRALHQVARECAASRLARARTAIATATRDERLRSLREGLARLLGDVEPGERPRVLSSRRKRVGRRAGEVVRLAVEPGVSIVVHLLSPRGSPHERPPVVLGVAQEGSRFLLRARWDVVSGLLAAGVAVCLVDVRGAGPSSHDDATRGRHSLATQVAATESMLGRTLLGARLRDLRDALAYLRDRPDLDARRVAAWGDSHARANRPASSCVPFDSEPAALLAEPLGGLLALLLALFAGDVRAVYARGCLTRVLSVLDEPFCHVPRDAIVPGLLTVSDLPDVVAALAPLPIRLEASVDGMNRAAGPSSSAADEAVVGSDPANWLARNLFGR